MDGATGLSWAERRQAGSPSAEITETQDLPASGGTFVATANTATDNYDLFLPNPAESKGSIFSITASIANAKVVTLKARGGPVGWTNVTLGTDAEYGVWISDGRRYVLIGGDAA